MELCDREVAVWNSMQPSMVLHCTDLDSVSLLPVVMQTD